MTRRVFVTYPVSSKILDILFPSSEEQLEQISLGYLRNLKISSIIKILRSTSQMQVILDDKDSEQLVDIFLLLFLFTKSKTINFLKTDFSVLSFQKRAALISLLKCVGATIFGMYCVLKSLMFLTLLKIKKRVTHKTIHPGKNNNILYLKTNFWPGVKTGGSVAHMEGVLSGLKKSGAYIDYTALDCPPPLKELINKSFFLPLPKFLSFDISLNLFSFDWSIHAYLKKIKIKKYDFIYHRLALNSLSPLLLSRKLGIPFILEYNGPEVQVQREWGKPLLFEKISQAIEKANIFNADYIVTVSDILKENLVHQGVSPEKIICYPNCVDPEKFHPMLFSKARLYAKRKKIGFAKKDIILTFVGSFGKWHGVGDFARVIHALYISEKEWIKKNNIKFLLIGDGPCMAEVKNILSLIPNYTDFVTLMGVIPQEEVPLYLSLSDILLSPHSLPNNDTRFFGSPTKLFEYMAMEKIIIASDLAQISQVLSPSIHINKIDNLDTSHLAVLCEPGNVESFKKAIQYVVNNLSTLNFMRQNTREKVIKKYTWDIHVQEILNTIHSPKEKLGLLG